MGKRKSRKNKNSFDTGGGVKYVGKKIVNKLGKHIISQKPIINEIEEIFNYSSSTLRTISLGSHSGFIYLLKFNPGLINYFRSDTYSNYDEMLPITDRFKLNTGKIIDELILKLLIVDDEDKNLPVLKISSDKIYDKKKTENQKDTIDEILNQNILYNNTFKYSGIPILPNIVGASILPNPDSILFLSSYLDTKHDYFAKYGWSTLNTKETENSLWYLRDVLSEQPRRRLAVIVMEKVEGTTLYTFAHDNYEKNKKAVDNALNQGLAIGLTIIVSTKKCPYDAHLGNWMYDPVRKEVKAIDFGRMFDIDATNCEENYINFINYGYKSYTEMDIKEEGVTKKLTEETLRPLFLAKLTNYFNIHESRYSSIDELNRILISQFGTIGNQISLLNPNMENLLSEFSQEELAGQGWVSQTRFQWVHKLIGFWVLMDSFMNATKYGAVTLQIGGLLRSIYNIQNLNLLTYLSLNNFSLMVYINSLKTNKEKEDVRLQYTQILEYIEFYKINPQGSIRIPKDMEITKKDILKKLNKTDEIQIRDPEFEDKESPPIEELIKKLSITKISPTKEKTIDELISKLSLKENKPKIILRKPVAGPAPVAAAAIAVQEEIPKIEIINKFIEEKKVPKVTKRKVTKRKPITGPIISQSEVIELGKKKKRSFSPMSIDFIQKRKKSRTPSPMKESPQYISDPRMKSLKSDEYVVFRKGGKKGKKEKKTLKIKKY